jgi:hypothetical protein
MGLTGSRTPTAPKPAITPVEGTPTAADLVSYLNRTAAGITALESRDLDLDVQSGRQSFGLSGTLFCQKPKNFRMVAKMPALRRDVADFGSNDREFWYWISENQPPYLFHCSYEELDRGDVRLPFPLKPDWVLEALGMGAPAPVGTPEEEQARRRTLDVRKSGEKGRSYFDLIERTVTPQGQWATKITRFHNGNASGNTPQVVGYYLYDGRNQLICQAAVIDVQTDPATQVKVPHKMKLEWPGMQPPVSLTLTLGDIVVNSPRTDAAANPELFTRPTKRGVQTFDLARQAQDGPPTAIRRAGLR